MPAPVPYLPRAETPAAGSWQPRQKFQPTPGQHQGALEMGQCRPRQGDRDPARVSTVRAPSPPESTNAPDQRTGEEGRHPNMATGATGSRRPLAAKSSRAQSIARSVAVISGVHDPVSHHPADRGEGAARHHQQVAQGTAAARPATSLTLGQMQRPGQQGTRQEAPATAPGAARKGFGQQIAGRPGDRRPGKGGNTTAEGQRNRPPPLRQRARLRSPRNGRTAPPPHSAHTQAAPMPEQGETFEGNAAAASGPPTAGCRLHEHRPLPHRAIPGREAGARASKVTRYWGKGQGGQGRRPIGRHRPEPERTAGPTTVIIRAWLRVSGIRLRFIGEHSGRLWLAHALAGLK